MTHEEYMEAIARTWPAHLTRDEGLCNAALGLVGEAMEWHRTGELDEFGDVLYYTCTLARLLDLGNPGIWAPVMSDLDMVFFVPAAARVAEAVKKIVFHKVDRRSEVHHALGDIIGGMEQLADLGNVRAANIRKLKRRYPDGFVPGGGIR